MSFASKAISIELIKKLSSLSYLQFQNYCRDLLTEVLPNTVATKEMRNLDAAGLDLFLLNDGNDAIEFAFQCKGFEVSFIKEKQTEQCINSIRSLNKLTCSVKSYFLIINRSVLKEERLVLENEVEIIKKAGLVNNYQILDNHGFIQFLYVYIRKNFENAITKSNQILFSQYKENLNQRFYYADVPFDLNEHKASINPSKFLKEGFQIIPGEKRQNDPTQNELSKYFFVIGDFGFGKTSLMFQSMLDLHEYSALYIPFSYFKKTDFQNQLEFVMVINSLVSGEHIDNKSLFTKFKSRVLASIIIGNPKLILLFDGMDENIYLGTTEGLRQLFYLLNEVKAKCVFSMRLTFWDEKQGNFTSALPKRRRNKDRIKLLEWENKNILEYLELYKTINSLNKLELENLEVFSNYIIQNKYHKFYGDIPKRPLFLEMILADVLKGVFKETSLSELYEKYFFKKFEWDTKSNFDTIAQGRPVTYTGDIYKGFTDMCKIMERIAGKMMRNDGNNNILLDSSIGENILDPIMIENKIENLNALLLNSVLTTTSGRTLFGIQVQFAHRSFQEYFTSRYIFNFLVDDYFICKRALSAFYPDTIASFLINYIEWMDTANSVLKHPNFKLIIEENWPENSLGDLIRIPFKEKVLR